MVRFTGNQAIIEDPSKSRTGLFHLDAFRKVPSPSDKLKVVAEDGDLLRLRLSSWEYVVNPGTGFVSESTVIQANERLFLFRGPVTHPGGVILPSVAGRFQFFAGRLDHMQVLVIEDAEFNIELPKDAFGISVPAGTVVIDERFPQTRGGRTPVALADVAEDVRTGFAQPTVPLTTPNKVANRNWLWGVAVVAMCVGVVTWARRRRGI